MYLLPTLPTTSSRYFQCMSFPPSHPLLFKYFLKVYLFYFLAVCVFCLHASLCIRSAQCLWRAVEGIRFPGTGVRDRCELLYRFWDPNTDPTQEQQVLLTTEPSLRPVLSFLTTKIFESKKRKLLKNSKSSMGGSRPVISGCKEARRDHQSWPPVMGCVHPLGAGAEEETDPPLKRRDVIQLCEHLDFGLVRTMLGFWLMVRKVNGFALFLALRLTRICCSSHENSMGRFRRSHPNKGICPGQRANFKLAKEKSCSGHIKPKYFSLPLSLWRAECAPESLWPLALRHCRWAAD